MDITLKCKNNIIGKMKKKRCWSYVRLVDFKEGLDECANSVFEKCLTEVFSTIVSRADFHSFDLGIRSEVKPIQNGSWKHEH